MTAFALFLVFVTGLTGLIYQVVWQRYLSSYLGGHSLATSLVLAVFFASMATGYYIIGKNQNKLSKNKLLLYGLIEGLIGIYAVLSPSYFHNLTKQFSFYSNHSILSIVYSLTLAFLFIGLPSFLMGGTIPVITQGLTKRFEQSQQIHAWVYSLNTFGAFCGALLSGFIMIEHLGLGMSLLLTGFVNIFVLLCCYLIFKYSPYSFSGILQSSLKGEEIDKAESGDFYKVGLYVISFLSGFYVFALEVLIIRMFSLSVGSTFYSYSLIVAAFIFSIAIGSFCVSLLQNIKSWMPIAVVMFVLQLGLIGLYFQILEWPFLFSYFQSYLDSTGGGFYHYWAGVFLIMSTLLVLPVGLMGANLPLLFSYLKSHRQSLASTIGRLYAWNAWGSFFGAVVGGYYIYNFLNMHQVFKFIYLLVMISAVVLFCLFKGSKKSQNISSLLMSSYLVLILCSGFFFLWFSPGWSIERFSPGSYLMRVPLEQISTRFKYNELRKKMFSDRKSVFEHTDPSTWVNVSQSVKDQGNKKDLTLFINGKPDASTTIDSHIRALNALIPLSVANEIENIFIIGLGGGLSTGISTKFPEVKKVNVAELSDGVIKALPYFNKANFNLNERLHKVKVDQVDALRKLRADQGQYDIILSEPSSLWVSGVESLYTLEFLEEAKKKLKANGIYSQWFPLFEIDGEALFSILDNFNKTFNWVTIWATDPFVLNILASNQPLNINEKNLVERFKFNKEIYQSYGMNEAHSILGLQKLTAEQSRYLSNYSRFPHTINYPTLEFAAVKARYYNQSVDLRKLLSLFK